VDFCLSRFAVAPVIILTDKVVEESNPDKRVVICVVQAHPKPSFSLYRQNGEHAKDRSDDLDPNNKHLSVYRQEYKVEGKHDFGEFICEASNEFGKNMVTHNVTETRPPPPKPEFINQPTSRQVNPDYELAWKVNSETKIVRFEVLIEMKVDEGNYRLVDSRNYTVAEEHGPEYVGHHLLNNLDRDHQYRIVVKAINSYSRESSNEIEFTISENSSAQSIAGSFFLLGLFSILMQVICRQRLL
jgi:hypothetical protein